VEGGIKRILKGKVERTYNHQWLQASRTRATRRVGKKDTRSDSASALCEDLCMKRFSVEAAVQDPCVRLSLQGAYWGSPQKILVRDLKGRSLFKLSRNNLGGRAMLSTPGLCTRSP